MLTFQTIKPAPALGRLLLAALLASTSAQAANGTWLGLNGDWGNTGTWSGGTIADGIDSTANFTGVDIAANSTITLDAGRTIGNITFTDATTSSHNLTISGANILTLDVTTGAPIIDVTQSGRTLTISSEIAGSDGLQKNGAGTLALTGVNTYTGTTTISAGILSLSGGNGRLASSGTVAFSGTSTLSIANNQTLSNVTVANGVTGTINGGGNLTLNGSAFSIGGTVDSTTQTLNMSGLSSFTYDNAAGIFKVGGVAGSTTNNTVSGTVVLPGTATITASSFGVGNTGFNSGTGINVGSLTLGATTTINANTIQLGNNKAKGTIQYASVSNPTLTLRGTDGSSPVTSMIIGYSAGIGNSTNASLVDLTTNVSTAGTFDAKITTLTIGQWGRTTSSSNTTTTTGELKMGGGMLEATTIILGQNAAGGSNNTASTSVIGTLTVSGGTVKTNNLYLGDQNATTNNAITGTFNLNGGAHLYAQTIDKGPGTGTQPATRTFNWNDGTIHNYDSSTDLTINNNLTTFALLGAGSHVFDISSGRQGTVNQVISGAGSLSKAGSGTLTLNGSNNYSGTTTVSAGKLAVDGSITSAVTVASNATLQGSGTINSTVNIQGGGTLAAAGGNSIDSLTSGNLTLAAAAIFAYDMNKDAAAGVAGDLMDVAGNLTIANTTTILTLAELGSGSWSIGEKLTLISYTGTWNSGLFNYNSNTLADDSSITFSGAQWTFNYNDTTGGTNYTADSAGAVGYVTMTVTAIPEPGTAVIGGLGVLLLLRRRRLS